jgi:hypothetical protein
MARALLRGVPRASYIEGIGYTTIGDIKILVVEVYPTGQERALPVGSEAAGEGRRPKPNADTGSSLFFTLGE